MPELPPLDTEHPNPARIYDYFLGGFHNFAVDRAAAHDILKAWPNAREGARLNRSYLRRAVQYLTAQGIDQFLDLGAGVPTVGAVHDVAWQSNPAATVVYVDNEPVAVKASELLLAEFPNAAAIRADLREPETILDNEAVRHVIDFDRPVAILLVSVLHFVSDDDVASAVVRRYIDAIPPGSFVAISHIADPYAVARSPEDVEALDEIYAHTANPTRWRSIEAIGALFDGTELVPPGLVHALDWHPGDTDVFGDDVLEQERTHLSLMVGIGRKP